MSKAVPAEVGAVDSDMGIESKLQVVKDSLSKIENVVKELGVLKSQVGELKQIEKYVEKLKVLISKVSLEKQPPDDGDRRESLDQQEWAALEKDDATLTRNANSQSLSDDERKCLPCLVEFPEKMAIKKRPLIYWWIGEGLIKATTTSTAEKVGEQVFQELLKNHCIRPTTSSSFMVYPWVHQIQTDRSKRVFLKLGKKDDVGERDDQHQHQPQPDQPTTVVNVDNKYLGTKLEELFQGRSLEVLQLGRWQDSATHHIEVEDYKTFLDGLNSQRQLKYLSLRGISRIETLPRSIKKLTALQILDLRACHNLEELPPEISELKKLTHLDVSECYLLDSMPKGIEGLSLLEVLKGFVVSNHGRKSCKIADLERLSNLRKLTIRLGNAKLQLPSSRLGPKSLRILTISWSFSDLNWAVPLKLPEQLIKLDLRSVPFDKVPEWLQPTKLPTTLEKLYIKGGKLKDLDHSHYGNIKFLRVSYLKELKTHRQEI